MRFITVVEKEIIFITLSKAAAEHALPHLKKALAAGTEIKPTVAKRRAWELYLKAVFQEVKNQESSVAGFIFCGETADIEDLAHALDKQFIDTKTKCTKTVVFTGDKDEQLSATLGAAAALCLFGEPNVYIVEDGIHLAWQYHEDSEEKVAVAVM